MTNSVDAGPSVCYRHQDRPTYIRCQRCGRPICPQCQTPGAVGVTCPECMRAQRAERPPRIPRLMRRARSTDAPVATYSLIAVTVLVFAAQWIPGLDVTGQLLYAPVYTLPNSGYPFEPWRALTSVFVHSQSFLPHILLNMWSLWIFGRLLEPTIGRARFVVVYLVSGVAGSLGVLAAGAFHIDATAGTAVVGASGAIFGLMGAFFIIQHRLGGNTRQLLIIVALNLGIGFIPGFGIAWQAHVGGLIAGGLAGLILVETRPLRRRPLQIGLLAALAVACVLGTLLPGIGG